MCGILGTIPGTDPIFFERALNTMIHRGPDDYGVLNMISDVTLGHRRLSIIDTGKGGHQPMKSNKGNFAIVFNGEIYNFLEIKKELNILGHTFVSSSDTEVLLKAYMQWGAACVLKFNGMWAFAIWDEHKKRLFLSRDRYGKKPLFYAKVRDKFIFASEMKAIYPFLDRVEPSDDFQWIRNNKFLYESSSKCLVKGIERFPKGSNGFYENGALLIERFWHTLDHLVTVPKKYDDQVECFRELFLDSCKLRMRSDVPIGTALSGGLDSSATIGAMASLANQNKSYSSDWQHAFVASFPGSHLDETYYAKKVTDSLGIGATFVTIDPTSHWDKIKEYLYLFEDLYITSPIPMIMTYGAVAKNGVKVTLDGHGADELMGGYQGLIEALWDSKFSLNKTLDVLNTLNSSITEGGSNKKQNNLKLYLNYMVKKLAKVTLGRQLPSTDATHKNYKKLDNFTKFLYFIFNDTILPTLLRNYDRYSMINSVEIRMPFMDHRIVNFVNSLPYSSKFGNGYSKKLIRDAIDPYLPKEVTWRKTKIGFNSPVVKWMQEDLKEWFQDTVHSKDFLQSSLIPDSVKLQNEIMDISSGRNNSIMDATKSWYELSIHLWELGTLRKEDYFGPLSHKISSTAKDSAIEENLVS